ncbi:hypothetical protein FRC17_002276 [Serendipita sp. 399]|nr:hypothetical protein FRC17_002276 [Serendipita sp. 399]
MPPKRRAASDVEGLPNSAPKRARFAEPQDDDRASASASKAKKRDAAGANENFDSAGFAEEVDATLDMAGRQKRKGAVKVDGYESDSTDDGEGVVLSRRKEEKEEDNEDMFAVGDGDDDEEKKDDGKKKQTRFLQLGEIEGQEFGADDEDKEFDGDDLELDEDSVSSSEPEDEDDAERRKKAGMGYELTKFNMKEEMEEGKIGREKKKKEAKLKKRDKGEDTSMHGSAKEGSKPSTAAQSDIDRITALASALMVDDPEVYSNTYEGILRSVRRSGIVPQDWKPPVAKYEYRWATAADGKENDQTIYGPFEGRELQQWYEAMFFGMAGEKIHLRKVGNDEWEEWDDIFV